MTRLGHVPALDGLRGVAIVGVLLGHGIGWPSGAGYGVTLFFVLSGFLITTLLLEEHATNGRVSFRSFYRRRALRLFPALFVFLVVYVLVAGGISLAQDESPVEEWVGAGLGAGYLMNIPATYSDPPLEIEHLWTLAMEEQFYILWPLVLFLALKAHRPLALSVLALSIGLMTVHSASMFADGATTQRLWYAPDVAAVPILVGCFFALLPAWARPGRWLGIVGTGLFVETLLFLGVGRTSVAPGVLVGVAVLCAITVSAALHPGLVSRALAIRPLRFFGRISYALYLWHVPIFVVVGLNEYGSAHWSMAIPAIVLALGLATASYYYVELPFLRRKRASRAEPARRALAAPAARRPTRLDVANSQVGARA